jgi:hypothetical protein
MRRPRERMGLMRFGYPRGDLDTIPMRRTGEEAT